VSTGRPQGGFRSDKGRAAYWRMQYESAIGALSDLIAENTENIDALRRVVALGNEWVGFDDSHHYGDALLTAVGPEITTFIANSATDTERTEET